ncbi:MAG TPA: EamA family transporter [Stellaceae bacterium]|nr:EamA family transporter [Stellaceae bacterium]
MAASERLALISIVGILLVSGGIMALGVRNSSVRTETFGPALLTGSLIGAYTVIDGMGVRLAGDGIAHTSAMFLLWSLVSFPLFFVMRGRPPAYGLAQTAIALAGGVVSYLAYGIVISAMQYAPMAVVSALRETSVLFAAVIGGVFLHERLTAGRFAACGAIAIGAACLAL